MFFCENGRMKVGKWTINDAHPHGWLSFGEVIKYSSNIGATKVGDRLGRERYARYLAAFGFGTRTGIELPGESPGIVRPVDSWARIDLATQSFGQGISVTALQMTAAFGAIANGGVLMRPYVVQRTVTASGQVTFEHQPTVVRRVVSPRTAEIVTGLLRRVVEEPKGTGSKAALPGFPVAGKTGTAQKVDPDGGGYSSKRIGSFVGYVPADAPRLAILVLIDEPTTTSYGGVVAAPVFRQIAAGALKRLGVEPSRPRDAVPAPALEVTRAGSASASSAAAPAPPALDDDSHTPSFLGLSLREALTRAQETGWDVRIEGTGYVRGQTPAPGTPLAQDRRLALRLVRDGGTAVP
jgi:cell division protein FtsI (penicillin-binding protein 3)